MRLVSAIRAPIALFFGVIVAIRGPEDQRFAIVAIIATAATFLTAVAAAVSN